MSRAYQGQTDGQTKMINQCLKTYPRCVVSSTPKQWLKWLPLAELWYNSCFHTSLQCSREYQSSLLERQQFLDLLKQNFARAQNKMKVAIDTKRSAHNFQLGEMVLLKLQPYAQSPVVNMPNYLLSKPSMSHNQVSVCIPLEII
jgi:hypothetical protein